RPAPTALTAATNDGESVLVAAAVSESASPWFIWLSDDEDRRWTQPETGAFALAAQVFCQRLSDTTTARHRELAARQASLEETAGNVRRLARGCGNILTGILGFRDLSLSLPDATSPAHQYAAEINRAARQGAELTQALRWFCRRASGLNREAHSGESASLAE